MKRLLWKEFRERRWWALAWALAILGVSLFGRGQAFYGEQGITLTPLLPLPFVIGLLIGAGAYAGELSRSQALFSRPITPRAVLAAKLLFAAIICFGTPLLAAAIAWGIASDGTRFLMSPWTLLSGAVGVGWLYGLCYLFGLTCSVVIPGYAGGILTLATAALPLIAALAMAEWLGAWRSYSSDPDGIRQSLHYYAYIAGWIFGCWLGVTCAGLSVSRFALVLSKEERVKRFTFVFLPVFLACGVVGILLPTGAVARLLMHWEVVNASISPTGKYALVSEERQPYTFGFALSPGEVNGSFGHARYLARMSDRERIPVLPKKFNYWQWSWVTDEIAYSYDWDKDKLLLVYPGRGTTRMLTMTHRSIRPYCPSPDGRLLLLYGRRSEKVLTHGIVDGREGKIEKIVNSSHILQVVDLDSGRIIVDREMEVLENRSLGAVWQDNDTLAYQRIDGQTEYLHIPLR
ncbi:MAG: ABC transporter permease [Armatimonadota bacterium]